MKKLSILLAVFFLANYAILPATSFAATVKEDVTELISESESEGEEAAGVTTIRNALFSGGKHIVSVIRTAGIVVALIIIVAFGVSWLVATPAKKAELKGKLWNIVIGVIILVAATQILYIAVDFIGSVADEFQTEGEPE